MRSKMEGLGLFSSASCRLDCFGTAGVGGEGNSVSYKMESVGHVRGQDVCSTLSVTSASKWPKLTDVPVPPGSSWAQEAGEVDQELERYSYDDDGDDDDDDEEEEEEETNMIPGSRDRGILTLPAEGPDSSHTYLPSLRVKQSKLLASKPGAQHAHTQALPSGCNLLHPQLTSRSAPLGPTPTPMSLNPGPHLA